MLDVLYYRDMIIDIVVNERHIAPEVRDLRLNLFAVAAKYYYNRRIKTPDNPQPGPSDVLEPFPSCFFDVVTKERRLEDLEACIKAIPELSSINVSTPAFMQINNLAKPLVYVAGM